MAASSSARRICPLGINCPQLTDRPWQGQGASEREASLVLGLQVAPIAGGIHGQTHSERRSARGWVALNDPAMIADELRDQSKSKATSLRLGGDEGIEQLREQLGRHAGAVVADAHFDRQADALARALDLQANPG